MLIACVVVLGCQGEDVSAGPTVAEQWAEARALWHIQREWTTAWAAWMAIDPSTEEGHEARRLLAEADPDYRRVIVQVREGDDRAPETWEHAARIAPMDPDLYLPLARAYRARSREEPDNPHLFIGAAEFYRKFLALRADSPEAVEARRELSEIDPASSRLELPPPEVIPASSTERMSEATAAPLWPLVVALLALALALLAVLLLFVRSRAAFVPLETLARQRPELHPAIAYLVSSLRHELLKHRIGAVGDAVGALGRGRATADQMAFLQHRLYDGQPLVDAWGGFVAAFERALGPELDLVRADRHFRRAGKAIARIQSLETAVRRADRDAVARLQRAHEQLRELDGYLASMVHRLVRTPVDGALFREVVDEVRTEYAAGGIALDEVVIRAPEPAPLVEVFRVDLVLILKNVVRNAILAVGEDAPPRRVGLDVSCEVEMTGEEVVRIHVRDTSPGGFTTEDIYARRVDRGLGLVTAALARYDGVITVEPDQVQRDHDSQWQKAVVVRFFRAYAEDD